MSTPRKYFRYLPRYPEIEGWGARVLDAGCTQVPAHQIYPAPGHPDDHHFDWETGRKLAAHTFVYITAGEGVFESKASGLMKVNAGDVFVIFPGVWHRFRPEIEVGWNEYWVECEGELLETAIRNAGMIPEHPIIPVGHDPALLECFTSILETIQNEPPGYQAIIGLQSVTILARIKSRQQLVQGQHSPSEEKIVRQAILRMSENLGGRMDWQELAAGLGISYSSFRRIFPKATGCSPGNFFLEMKMNRAKRLLGTPGKSIQEISVLLGFDSSSHFSHSFKSRVGVCPRGFRGGDRA